MQHGGGDIAKMSFCKSWISMLDVFIFIIYTQGWK